MKKYKNVVSFDVDWNGIDDIKISNFEIITHREKSLIYYEHKMYINLDNIEVTKKNIDKNYYTVSLTKLFNHFLKCEWYICFSRELKLKRILKNGIRK
jgi:hypothetical protein